MPEHGDNLNEIDRDDLLSLLQDAHGDVYLMQVMLGASAVPRQWHVEANRLLEKYRPITDRIQAVADRIEIPQGDTTMEMLR